MRAMSAATAATIALWYELGDPVSEPAYADRGEMGCIWRLDTEIGTWAVKELLVPAREAEAARDVAFQLAAEAAGVPLPRPRLTRDGRVVLPADQAASQWDIRVNSWADLAPGQIVTGAEIGDLAARLHAVPHSDPRPAGAWFSKPIGAGGWQSLLREARAGQASWLGPLEHHLRDLAALDAAIVPTDQSVLRTCHRDVNTENVRRRADGGVIVLDWESSGPAQPERELAAIVSDLAVDASMEAACAAYTAYQAAAGPAALTKAADFSLAAAAQGHLLQFYNRRALDPAELPETRARARIRLDRMLRHPLTSARIDHLLELLI